MGIEHCAPSDCKALKASHNLDRVEGGIVVAPSPDKGHLGEFGKTLNLIKLYNAPPTLTETLVYAGCVGVAAQQTKQLGRGPPKGFGDRRSDRGSSESEALSQNDKTLLTISSRTRKKSMDSTSQRPTADRPTRVSLRQSLTHNFLTTRSTRGFSSKLMRHAKVGGIRRISVGSCFHKTFYHSVQRQSPTLASR